MGTVLESLLTTLFKFSPLVFENGRLGFETSRFWLILFLAGALLATTVVGVMAQRSRVGLRSSWILASLRVLSVALLTFVLLRPVLRTSTAVPGENFLAVLIDDSRSMQLADAGREPSFGETDSKTRGARALETFASPSSEVLAALQQRFTLRTYRFSDVTARIDPAQAADFEGQAFNGHATHLGAALDHIRQDLAGVPLAGAVLVSDGGDNAVSAGGEAGRSEAGRSGAGLTEALLQLTSRGIPIYTVGLGRERFRRDIELTRVSGPSRVLAGSSFAVDVLIEQQGYDDRTVTLTVEEGGGIATTREVAFARGRVGQSVRINLQAEEAGSRSYRFAVEPEADEEVKENNARTLLLAVEDRQEKILYFEGEPRWEVKFLRQALVDDDPLRLVVLQRTAKDKTLRLGVDGPLELASGFPNTREELFAYRGLILGTVEAAHFTANQLQIIEEFVSQRGGGVLFLGGRRSFAEGGYAGTPLENVFPVVLEEPVLGHDSFLAEVSVTPTLAGETHAALQLGATVEASRQRWQTLPPLTTRNPLTRIKPGASLLLSGLRSGGLQAEGEELVILASQRYGRGRAVAFPVQDSWMWQMHADLPLDDMTHERLWRQLLRWLVSAVPGQVRLDVPRNQVAPGEAVTLKAEVLDAGYLGLNGAQVRATVTDPVGDEQTVPLAWTVEEDGEYRASFVPGQPGTYEVTVTAEEGGELLGSDSLRVVAGDQPTEFFGAEMKAPLLRRLAEETGGRFYTADTVGTLADDARFTTSGKTMEENLELWDMPMVLLLLLTALGTEWLLRRRWGLA